MMQTFTTTLPRALYRAEQVRELDRQAIEHHQISGYTLMCRAGAAAFAALNHYWPDTQRIVVACGSGNNGGDGYVIARLAHSKGLHVTVLALAPPEKLSGDALTAYQDCRKAGVTVRPAEQFALDSIKIDLIVDAIFGTGLQRNVSGRWYDLIAELNQQPAPILAIDLPSGLHADRGVALGIAIQAASTISFIGLKQGLFTSQGRDYCGNVLFADLAVPTTVYATAQPSSYLYHGEDLVNLLPPRQPSSHKGDFGHVLLIGGNYGMAGAIRMAAEACARCGAGLTTVATRPEHAMTHAALRPEVMFRGIATPAELDPLLERASVIALGPGLGTDVWAQALFDKVMQSPCPLVIDADALNLLAINPLKNNNWILTPHPGEAGRLIKQTSKDIQADRFTAVKALQDAYQGTIILKGSGTLITNTQSPTRICSAGNPGMASGGMGDVLTGIIAALLAQHLPPYEAASAGVYIHAKAADNAVLQGGQRGLLATDLLPQLIPLVNPPVE